MNVQVFKDVAKIALPVLFAALALPAFAEDVTFTTTGSFSCGTATGCTTSGAGSTTVTFENASNSATINVTGDSYVALPAGDSAVDDVNVAQFTTTSMDKSPVTTTGADFTLTIDQTVPGPATSGSLDGSFTGTISTSATSTVISFATTSLVLNNITYTLDSSTWTIPNSGIGSGSIGMTADTATVTPEPAFMILTGFGFGLLAFIAYRRRQAV